MLAIGLHFDIGTHKDMLKSSSILGSNQTLAHLGPAGHPPPTSPAAHTASARGRALHPDRGSAAPGWPPAALHTPKRVAPPQRQATAHGHTQPLGLARCSGSSKVQCLDSAGPCPHAALHPCEPAGGPWQCMSRAQGAQQLPCLLLYKTTSLLAPLIFQPTPRLPNQYGSRSHFRG